VITQAAVLISEVAWMGSINSANDEWIELHNTGGAVNLDGWYLRDGMNLEIGLSGSLAAGQYATLERTDDTSASGVAFLIYTGALSNVGATLTLYNAADAIVDQVAGGANWDAIGGDNVTKETAQFTNRGWITAQATPGRLNAASGSIGQAAAVANDQDGTNNGSAAAVVGRRAEDSPSSLFLIPQELTVAIAIPKTVLVNQATEFLAIPSGSSKGILQSLTYEWNFGDFTTSAAPTPIHHYAYPGNYVVTLKVYYNDYEAEFRQSLVALPVTVSMTNTASGDIQIHNDARYELDVSGYRLGGMTFPPRSIILPGSTITVPKARLGSVQSGVVLHDEMKQVVARITHAPIVVPPVATAIDTSNNIVFTQSVAAPLNVAAGAESDFIFATQKSEGELEMVTSENNTNAVEIIDEESIYIPLSTPTSSSTPYGYIGLVVLLALALGGVYIRQR